MTKPKWWSRVKATASKAVQVGENPIASSKLVMHTLNTLERDSDAASFVIRELDCFLSTICSLSVLRQISCNTTLEA